MDYNIRIVKMDDVDPASMLDSGDKITDPYMTGFEFARLIGVREFQLKNGEQPCVDTENETNTLEIARKELYELVIPLVIQRTVPDGRTEWWKVSELHIAD
jgi:DNA-directed RNA polymerase subunit K/omega